MKLTEKELNEFPIGTKIIADNYTFGEIIYIKTNQPSTHNWYAVLRYNKDIKGFEGSIEILNSKSILKVEIPTYTEYIQPQPILDDKEKEYLSAVIGPFRNKIQFIHKCKWGGKDEYISIVLKDEDFIDFPAFKKGTMYKGMELDREYSLDELGL